jgi:plastocyanin
VETGRVGKLGELGTAATSPQKLADALAEYSNAHDDSTEAKDFKAAMVALPAWEAVTAWSAVQPRPSVLLADRPQKERDAVAAAIDEYVQAHPSSPYGSACEALTPLLAGAPDWRVYLTEKLESMEEFTYWMIERKDGSRWYCKGDPRSSPLQTQDGVAVKNVMVYQGSKSKKTTFEKFEQLQLKTEGPSPQTVFRKQLAELIADDEKSVNDIDGAFDAISALRENETVDGALAALLMQGLLESMAPHMPTVVRPQIEAAAKRIAKEKPDTIDWINPRDTDARTRSRAARAAMREAVQPELWRKEYVSAMESACAPLAMVYEPAGVFVKSGGKDVFLPNKVTVIPANTTLWIAEPPPIGSNLGMMIRLGTVKQDGVVEFAPAATTVTSGNMVFTIKLGGKP